MIVNGFGIGKGFERETGPSQSLHVLLLLHAKCVDIPEFLFIFRVPMLHRRRQQSGIVEMLIIDGWIGENWDIETLIYFADNSSCLVWLGF